MKQNVYTDKNLALYYRFNEPKDLNAGIKNVVLDRSGNSLHSRVRNYSDEGIQRITGPDDSVARGT